MRHDGHVISYGTAYRIMRDNGLVTPSVAKSRKRRWVRYERRYSNALWHTDWHVMKDPRFRGLCLITFLDDSSRCVTGARLFTEATSDNAVTALAEAIGRFGTPAAVLSDNGRCFNGGRSSARGGRRMRSGKATQNGRRGTPMTRRNNFHILQKPTKEEMNKRYKL